MCDVLVPGGLVFHNATDIDLPGYPTLTFRRFYSSGTSEDSSIGRGWTHSWLQSVVLDSNRIQIKDEKGQFTLTYDQMDGITQPKITTLGGTEVELTYPDHSKRTFTSVMSDSRLYLFRVQDPNGNWTNLDYDAECPTLLKDSSGRYTSMRYQGGKLTELVVTHRGLTQTCTYYYDSQGRLIRAVDPNGNSESFSYDGNLLVIYSDQTGLRRYFVYDPMGRCVLNWYGDGLKIRRLELSPDGKSALLTDSYGYRELYRLDDANRVIRKTDPTFRTTEWIYEPKGGLVAEVLPDGTLREAATWIDPSLLRKVDLRGCETTYVYDRDHRISHITNGVGDHLTIEEDAKGNLKTLIAPGGAIWQFEYDVRGSLVQFRNPRGEWIMREENEGFVRAYDAIGSLGNFYFDSVGNLLASEDELGRRTTYEYAGQNLLTLMRRPDASRIQWKYDARGRITSVFDGLGRETRYEYSPFGSVTRTIRPDGSTERVVFDKEEAIREIINTLGEKTTIDVDENSRATRIVFFDGRSLQYSYDLRNQIVSSTDTQGRTTHFEYDGANNAQLITLPDNSLLEYSYDEIERLKSITFLPCNTSHEAASRAEFAYTENNYVAGEIHDDYEAKYHHDIANDLTGITDNLGRRIQYQLGRWGSVVSIDDDGRKYDLVYSAAGELVGLRLPNGMTQEFEYDTCSRVVHRRVLSATGDLRAWRTYRYDAADQLVGIDDWARGRFEYRFDLRGRVHQVIRPDGETDLYDYDSEGNLLSGPDFRSARIGSGNRLHATETMSFEYDSDGRITSWNEGQMRYELQYNSRDQVVGVSRDGTVLAKYNYDLVGRRTHKILPNETVRFYHHVNVLSSQVSSVSGRCDFLFLPFTFIPLAETRERHSLFYSFDQSGVPTEVWHEDGSLVATIGATAFGSKRVVAMHGSEQVLAPFHFMGQYIDGETGLCYSRFRYYHPPTSRFMSQDPFGLGAGLNLYLYPRNPFNIVDPLGLQGFTIDVKCVPSEPPPFTPCEQAALQTKIEIMNANLQNQNRKARCTKCRENEQKDYFIETCKGKVPKGWQVDHIQELQVGGGDKCCSNLMAIPARPNGSCGSQVYHQLKDFGGTVVGARIAPPGCNQAHKCKSDGTRRGQDSTSCDEPNPITQNC